VSWGSICDTNRICHHMRSGGRGVVGGGRVSSRCDVMLLLLLMAVGCKGALMEARPHTRIHKTAN